MSTYVMADIHGCYKEFQEMLEKIQFSDADQLILAGDYVDRGPCTYEMMEWVSNAPENVILLKGNHDLMFARSIYKLIYALNIYGIDGDEINEFGWFTAYATIGKGYGSGYFDYYGTLREITDTKSMNRAILERWMLAIQNMPYYYETKIGEETHIIAHAGYATEDVYDSILDRYRSIEEFYITAREDALYFSGLQDCTLIVGHTPTIAEGDFYNAGQIFETVKQDSNLKFYDIDCGIVYKAHGYPDARLGCMRLEDKEKFYVG